jgi:hypothetical protein
MALFTVSLGAFHSVVIQRCPCNRCATVQVQSI